MNLRRLRATREGGSWKDWDEDLQLDCHKKDGGRSFRAVYGRMSWDEPSPVITTQCLGIGNGRFGHPSQDRAISIREAAILQSFPPDFDFVPEDEDVCGLHLARQIGNAVPPRLGQAIARSIKLHLKAAAR
jgi:DNA (cytosine-5)-methyltransferase 1